MSLRRYLLWFAHENIGFKLPELESVCSYFNIPVSWVQREAEQPFVIMDLPSEQCAQQLASRTVLLRSVYELWGHGRSPDELIAKLKELPNERLSPYASPKYSFRLRVDTFGKSISKEEKLKKIDALHFLPLDGSIDLRNPTHSFHWIEYYGNDPNDVPDCPYDAFFGKWVCDGKRDAIHKLSLKQRKFIGNTSMDSQLSLIMANQAKIGSGSLVLDPFVGTGSLLVAAAYFGAYVFGNDLDYLTIHGKAKSTRYNKKHRDADESILANMHQYGLQDLYMDVVIGDTSRPLWRTVPLYDAIITDPPYGIREATEKIGSHKTYKIAPEHVKGHIPSRVQYTLGALFLDLLELASHVLKLHGRLVFWVPVYNDDSADDHVPTHPCFTPISSSGQSLTRHSSRYLITLEKCREPRVSVKNVKIPDAIGLFRERYFQYQSEHCKS